MSEVHFAPNACGMEPRAAESGEGETRRLITKQARTKTRGVAKASATPKAAAKAAAESGKEGAQESKAAEAIGKTSGRAATAADSEGRVPVPSDDVKSVEELAVLIRRDPENRKKRLKLAEALREQGSDELKVAEVLHALTAKLTQNKEPGAAGVASAKLLLDVLKEITHVLEPQKAVGSSDSGDAPQFIRLVHNVPRPVRTE
jgi:hypothetical protein